MSDEQELPPLSDSDEEVQQEASFQTSPSKSKPTPPKSSATTTPSNTPVVNLFAKSAPPSASNATKRGFEGKNDQELVNKMLSSLNVDKKQQDGGDDDDDEDDDEDEDDEEDEEDEEYVATPEQIQAALPPLQENQEALDKLIGEYQLARRELELKFQALRKPLYDARANMLNNDQLPGFWLDAMRRNQLLVQFVEEWDEECLMFLDNVTCEEINEGDSADNAKFGFELTFSFAEGNPYFTNRTLKKRVVVPNHYPMDGGSYPDVVACEGTEIDWKPNKNLTVRVEVKKQAKRAGGRRGGGNAGPQREVRQEVPQESFFTFFETAQDLTEEEMAAMTYEEQDQVQRKWETDFAIASTFRGKLVPNAVNWYTGDASDSEYDDDEEEEEEDEYDDDQQGGGARFQQLDDEDDDDDDESPSEDDEKPKKGGNKKKQQNKSAEQGGEEKKPECNQQ